MTDKSSNNDNIIINDGLQVVQEEILGSVNDDGKVVKSSVQNSQSDHVTKGSLDVTNSSIDSGNNETSTLQRDHNRRLKCIKCNRPKTVCICIALPKELIQLHKCYCIILQHPNEIKRKNRTCPFIQYCIHSSCIDIIIGKRFGYDTPSDIIERIQRQHQQHQHVWLIYPSDDAISLSKAIENLKINNNNNNVDYNDDDGTAPIVTLIFLDATWKYAKEMDKANIKHQIYPKHMIRVTLTPNDLIMRNDNDNNSTISFKPKRFDIRTPPPPQSDNDIISSYLSTAECVAWVISKIECNINIYNTIMKPLDLMVQQWHTYMKK